MGDPEAKVPLPNFPANFPTLLRERIASNRFYDQKLSSHTFQEVKEALYQVVSCELGIRDSLSLDLVPSAFVCILYRLLMMKLTEGQLRGLLNNRNRWCRCAAFLYVRMGVHQERYWELLSDALIDDEEFVPFPDGGAERITEGRFVELLLTKEQYCELSLPRISAALRRTITERLVLYDEFRLRYAANRDARDRYASENGGVEVEVCTVEGEWTKGTTCGPPSPGSRRVTVPVRVAGAVADQQVSLGMLICPRANASAGSDLIWSRGQDYRELIGQLREQQRDAAVSKGRGFCKTSGRHAVHAGGQTFICGGGEKRQREEDSEDEGCARPKDLKRSQTSKEQQQQMAAIVHKYCAGGRASKSSNLHGEGVEEPLRMRLG